MKEILDLGVGRARTILDEFKDFLLKYNFVSMAVGVVLGNAVTDVVNSLVKSLIEPLIAVLAGSEKHLGWVFTIRGQDFPIGSFVGQLIHFAIIAVVVFIVMKIFVRVPPPEPTKACSECLEKIPLAARKCKACGSSQGQQTEPQA